jgi:hypothetical protein
VTERVCIDCASPITAKNRTGRCRVCVRVRLNADPEIMARRTSSIREYLKTPEASIRRREVAREVANRPDQRQIRRENGKRFYHLTIGSKKAKEAAKAPEVIGRRSKTLSKTLLTRAGIPMEYREVYLQFLRRHIPKEEAVRMIQEEIRLKAIRNSRRTAKPKTFEEQLEAVRNGASVVEKPILKTQGPEMTLGGITEYGA